MDFEILGAIKWYWSALAIVFIIISIMLIFIVLLQKGRGGGLSAAFGGMGGQSAFGSKTGDYFTWVTVGVVAFFLLLAMVLTVFYVPTTELDATPPGLVGPPGATPPGAPPPVTNEGTPAPGGEATSEPAPVGDGIAKPAETSPEPAIPPGGTTDTTPSTPTEPQGEAPTNETSDTPKPTGDNP